MDYALPGMTMAFGDMMGLLGSGLIMAGQVFIVTLIGSLILGIPLALMRMSKVWIVSGIARIYISIMRGTPLMLQLMAWMFGPFYIGDALGYNVQMDPNWKYIACDLGFVLNYAAYFAEIYRSGIQSIPRGQYEAADILGYTRMQTFMKIVLPQVIKRILPAMGNEIITLVKDTSLAFVLGIAEMFTQAKAIAASNVSMWPYAAAAAIYWVINLIIAGILGRIEKRLNYYHD